MTAKKAEFHFHALSTLANRGKISPWYCQEAFSQLGIQCGEALEQATGASNVTTFYEIGMRSLLEARYYRKFKVQAKYLGDQLRQLVPGVK